MSPETRQSTLSVGSQPTLIPDELEQVPAETCMLCGKEECRCIEELSGDTSDPLPEGWDAP